MLVKSEMVSARIWKWGNIFVVLPWHKVSHSQAQGLHRFEPDKTPAPTGEVDTKSYPQPSSYLQCIPAGRGNQFCPMECVKHTLGQALCPGIVLAASSLSVFLFVCLGCFVFVLFFIWFDFHFAVLLSYLREENEVGWVGGCEGCGKCLERNNHNYIV